MTTTTTPSNKNVPPPTPAPPAPAPAPAPGENKSSSKMLRAKRVRTGTTNATESNASADDATNYCSRLLGPLLIWTSILLGLWIETSAVRKYRRLAIGLQHVVPPLSPSIEERNQDVSFNLSHYHKELIYLSTAAPTTNDTQYCRIRAADASSSTTTDVEDPLFGISRPGHTVLQLQRHVELYQWVQRKRVVKVPERRYQHEGVVQNPHEEKDSADDESSYSTNNKRSKKKTVNLATASVAGEMMSKYHYEQKWVSHPIDASNFKYPVGHGNVGSLPISSETFWTDQLTLELMLSIGTASPVTNVISIADRKLLEQVKGSVPILLQSPSEEQPPPEGARSEMTNNTSSQAVVTKIPTGYHLTEHALFFRTSEEVPVDDDEKLANNDGNDKSKTKTKIVETSIKMDGQETTLYQLVASGESFSSRELAEEAVLMLWVTVHTFSLDGNTQTLYQVGDDDERYSSKDKALEHAARLKQQEDDYKASLPAAQRNKKFKFLPQIGDVRVRFTEVRVPTNLSIVAQLWVDEEETGGTIVLQPWFPPGSGNPIGDERGIALLSEGYKSAQELFDQAQKDTVFVTWIARFGAWLVGMIGVVFVTQFGSAMIWIERAVTDPFQIVLGMWGTNLILPGCSGMVVASFVWSRTQPMVAIGIGFLGTTLLFGIIQWGKQKRRMDEKAKVD